MAVLLFYDDLGWGTISCTDFTPDTFIRRYGKRTLDDHPSTTVAEWLETAKPGDYEYFDNMWVVVIPDKE